METIREVILTEENQHILVETVPKELTSLIQVLETMVTPGAVPEVTLDSLDHNKVVAKEDTRGDPVEETMETIT